MKIDDKQFGYMMQYLWYSNCMREYREKGMKVYFGFVDLNGLCIN